MRTLFLLLFITSIFSCKTDTSEKSGISGSESGSGSNDKPSNPADLYIPGACDMISVEWLKNTLGLALSDIAQKESDNPDDKSSRSCFFRWEDPSTPNAGILIQIMTNPVYEEFDRWISHFVDSKISQGETELGSDVAEKYERFQTGNLKGAYSTTLKRFYWHKGNDYLYMLAFNMDIPASKMLDYGTKITEEVNKNFEIKVKERQ